MRGFVHVTALGVGPSEPLGKQAFDGVCASCHGLAGEGLIGPPIASSPTLEDPKALGDLVKNGAGKMPAVGKTWDDRLINALAGYLKTKFGGSGGG
jgi:mono/diheme cytochrome c family protein